jgi:hypothetical protein
VTENKILALFLVIFSLRSVQMEVHRCIGDIKAEILQKNLFLMTIQFYYSIGLIQSAVITADNRTECLVSGH